MTNLPVEMVNLPADYFPARNPDKPEPKKLLFTAEHAENAEMFFFYYKIFSPRSLRPLR
jgi:hypothetical protein